MAEGSETFVAVIASHPAVSDASERRARRCNMEQAVVDAASSEGELPHDPFRSLRILAEVIKRQRLGAFT